MITEDYMKKKYIKPYFMVFKVHPVQVIAESFSIMETGDELDGTKSEDQDNSVWSREDVFNNGGNIWDNAW